MRVGRGGGMGVMSGRGGVSGGLGVCVTALTGDRCEEEENCALEEDGVDEWTGQT